MATVRTARDRFDELHRRAGDDLARLRDEAARVAGEAVRLREGIVEAFGARLDRQARDAAAYQALDLRAGGALGTRACLDELAARRGRAHDAHRAAVEAAERAGERLLARVGADEEQGEATLDAGVVAESARRAFEDFDPAFREAHLVVTGNGVDDATLGKPGFRMVEPGVRAARAAVKRYAGTGRDYIETRDSEYLPLQQAWRDAARAWDTARLRRDETGKQRREAERASGDAEGSRKQARRELGSASDAERDPVPALRKAATTRLAKVLEFSYHADASPEPLGRLAKAGLLTGEDLASAGRCAALGRAGEGLKAQVAAQEKLARELSEALYKLDKGVRHGAGYKTVRVNLDTVAKAVLERGEDLDALLGGVAAIRTPSRPAGVPDVLMPDMLTWGMLYALSGDAGTVRGGVDARVDMPEVRVEVPVEIRVDIPDVRVDVPSVDTGGSSWSNPSSFGME